MSSEIEVSGDNSNNPEDCSDALSKIEKEDTNVEGPEQSWLKNEKELQNKIAEYESTLEQEKCKNASLQKDLQARTEERDNLKTQVIKLEKELAKNSLKGTKDHSTDTNDMVTKARSVIFEKTKTCKNQELQIEALTQQVAALKEIVSISKDMLDIRNIEVKQLQDKLSCIELKFTAEKDRHLLMHTKLEKMMKLNEELKTEYQNQLALFTELKKAYTKHQTLTSTESQNEINDKEPA
ncbi:hypothetical protein ILUMI_04784 [Ignelater luminosus]|uniref:Uncharacterized protein n=1 Tax=Ignelater luminosus TaxID=2038154 RepID=A0A8K0GH09_IGNLU|nr:hypothetical protein ILUMI_04784 [Ignelater luminosus]